MRNKTLFTALALVLLISAASVTSWSASPNKDNLAVTAQTSSSGYVPTVPGDSATHNWFYALCVPDTQTPINETFPVDFTLTNANGTSPENVTIHVSAVGGLSGSTTVPADFAVTDDGSTTTKNIVLNSGPLAAGLHSVNVQISGSPSSKVQIDHATIHIQVTVGAGCPTTGTICYFTDSDYNLLKDCGGNDVGISSGGTFQIVVNSKKVAATNPGQFYYNLIWSNNTGQSQPITIYLSNNAELVNQGANSVHAMTFDSGVFVADFSAWNMVNQNGKACGPSGPCTVNVNVGETLFVTWHVKYSKLGLPVPAGIPASCSQNGPPVISVTGILKDAGGNELGRCTATAAGYLKQ